MQYGTREEMEREGEAINGELRRLDARTDRITERIAAFGLKGRRVVIVALRTMGIALVAQWLSWQVVTSVATRLEPLFDALANRESAAVAAPVLLVIAIFVGWLKQRHRLLYGSFELGIAMATCQAVFVKHEGGVAELAAVFGVMYFAVRGYENQDEGYQARMDAMTKELHDIEAERAEVRRDLEALRSRWERLAAQLPGAANNQAA